MQIPGRGGKMPPREDPLQESHEATSPSPHDQPPSVPATTAVVCLIATIIVTIALCITCEWYYRKKKTVGTPPFSGHNTPTKQSPRANLRRSEGTSSLLSSSSTPDDSTRLQISTKYHRDTDILHVDLLTLVVSETALPQFYGRDARFLSMMFIRIELTDAENQQAILFKSKELPSDTVLSFREDFDFLSQPWDAVIESELKFTVCYTYASKRESIIGQAVLDLKSHLSQVQFRRGNAVWLTMKECRRSPDSRPWSPYQHKSRGYLDMSIEYVSDRGQVRILVHTVRDLAVTSDRPAGIWIVCQLIHENRAIHKGDVKVPKSASSCILVHKQLAFDTPSSDFRLLFEVNIRRWPLLSKTTRIGRILLGGDNATETEREHWENITAETKTKTRMEHELHS